MSLTGKFVLALLVALSTCCLAVVSVASFCAKKTLEKDVDRNLKLMTNIVIKASDNTFSHFEHLAAFFAQDQALIKAVELFDQKNVARIVRDYLNSEVDLDFITITDKNTMVMGRAHSPKWGDYIANQRTVLEALQGRAAQGVVLGSEVPFSFRASHPLQRQDGTIVGSLSLGLNLAVPDYVDWLKAMTGLEVSIFLGADCVMTTIMKGERRQTREQSLAPEIAAAVLQDGQSRVASVLIEGVHYKAAYWPVRDLDGNIVGCWFLGDSLEDLMAAWNQSVYDIITAVFALLVLLTIIFVPVSIKISAPIRKISRYIQEVSNNKLDARLNIYGANDIGELAAKLRNMVAILRTRNDKMRELSYRDALTGLWNRRYFMIVAKQEISLALRYEQKICLGMADIDFFKQVNDSYGHSAGDMVLKHVADLFGANLRASDTVARYGGEEFCFLLPHTSLQEGRVAMEKLRRLCEASALTLRPSEAVKVTVSFGVAALSQDEAEQYHSAEKELALLIERADRALYRSKREGRNRVTMDAEPELDPEAPAETNKEPGAGQSET